MDQLQSDMRISLDYSKKLREYSLSLINKPDIVRVQADGAKVFIQKIGDKFRIIVMNEKTKEIVTALKSTTKKKIMHLAKNYG